MEIIIEKVGQAFSDSYKEYERIFKDLKDLEGSEGFKPWANEERLSIHETNQVANFLVAYKKSNENCITWHELSVPYKDETGKNKTNHVDGFIIDGNKVIFIEAKRFSRVNNKQQELCEDLENIVDIMSKDSLTRFRERLPSLPEENDYAFYCLLLADYWMYRNMKTKTPLPYPINWDKIVRNYVSKVNGVELLSYSSTEDLIANMDNDYHLAYALFKLR